MKVMFNLGSMTKGGAERVIANLSNNMIKSNEIIICVTKYGKSMYEIDPKIKYYTLDCDEKKHNFLKKNFTRIHRLNNIVKQENPDIIVSLLPEPTYRLMLVNMIRRKKVIISVRNDPKVEYKSKINNIIMKILYPKADGFIFQTEEARDYFCQKIKDKSVIIPNPINDDFIQKPYEGEREKIIVSVGRLTEQKNQKMLINAFSKLDKKFEDYKLVIYGEGELRRQLENQIQELQLEKRVFLPGETDCIKEKIYKSSLFVLSSDYEGMPNALMEAMALGLPCISTDCPCGGPKYLIKNEYNGLLVGVKNEEELAKKINEVLSDKELSKKIGNNANEISKELNSNIIINKWISYIQKVGTNK